MFLDQNTLYLGIALLILVTSNILLGSINSIFQQQFDKTKLYIGMGKGTLIVVVLIGILFAGKLTPDIASISINNQNINLFTATQLIMYSAYGYYGKEVFAKLTKILTGKYIANDITDSKPIISQDIAPLSDSKTLTDTIIPKENSEAK